MPGDNPFYRDGSWWFFSESYDEYGPYSAKELAAMAADSYACFELTHCRDWPLCIHKWLAPDAIVYVHSIPGSSQIEALVQHFKEQDPAASHREIRKWLTFGERYGATAKHRLQSLLSKKEKE